MNRAMLSRTADANTLERCLSLNDELRKILASLKGRGNQAKISRWTDKVLTITHCSGCKGAAAFQEDARGFAELEHL